jgi:hypothetical protein
MIEGDRMCVHVLMLEEGTDEILSLPPGDRKEIQYLVGIPHQLPFPGER